MPKGERLLGFLTSLMLDRFHGTVTIYFEAGKVTHVRFDVSRTWTYKDLPGYLNENRLRAGKAGELAVASELLRRGVDVCLAERMDT